MEITVVGSGFHPNGTVQIRLGTINAGDAPTVYATTQAGERGNQVRAEGAAIRDGLDREEAGECDEQRRRGPVLEVHFHLPSLPFLVSWLELPGDIIHHRVVGDKGAAAC